MECNNEYCTWCSFGQCCHESEEGYTNATPNQLDCPSALRNDFEQEIYACYFRICEKAVKLNSKQIHELESVLDKIIIKAVK